MTIILYLIEKLYNLYIQFSYKNINIFDLKNTNLFINKYYSIKKIRLY